MTTQAMLSQLLKTVPVVIDLVEQLVDWALGDADDEPVLLSEVPATTKARLVELRQREIARREFEAQGAPVEANE